MALLGILLAVLFAYRLVFFPQQRLVRVHERVRQEEAACLSLSNSVAAALANRDWQRMQCYFAFKEIEVGDQQAWEVACRQVDEDLTSLSNSLQRSVTRLAKRKAELEALESSQ